MSAIAFKVAVAILTALAGAWAARSPVFTLVPETVFLRRVLALQLLPAVGLFVALYLVGGKEVTSDVPAYYLPYSHAVLSGRLPYRDFALSYAPLFPYVGGALLLLWNSGKIFALFAILVNALALVQWHRAAFLSEPAAARRTSIYYATSGLLVVQTLLGANQVWVAAALSGSALLQLRGRDAGSGFVQSACLCVTKFLTLLFWPILFACASKRTRWVMAAFLLPVLVYGMCAVLGGDLFDPVRREGNLITSGNLPYLVEPLLHEAGQQHYWIFDAATALILLGTLGWFYWTAQRIAREQRRGLLFAGIALVGIVFMLVSKKSYTGYAVFFMYPAILVLVRGSPAIVSTGFLLIFNVLLVAEPSVWFHLGGDGRTLDDWLPRVSRLAAGVFVAIEVALLTCYGYLAYLSAVCARRTVAGEIVSRSDNQCATACSLV